ncbi:MAG: ATP-binding cassette domain-containing protein [Dongiaceae bacterium]
MTQSFTLMVQEAAAAENQNLPPTLDAGSFAECLAALDRYYGRKEPVRLPHTANDDLTQMAKAWGYATIVKPVAEWVPDFANTPFIAWRNGQAELILPGQETSLAPTDLILALRPITAANTRLAPDKTPALPEAGAAEMFGLSLLLGGLRLSLAGGAIVLTDHVLALRAGQTWMSLGIATLMGGVFYILLSSLRLATANWSKRQARNAYQQLLSEGLHYIPWPKLENGFSDFVAAQMKKAAILNRPLLSILAADILISALGLVILASLSLPLAVVAVAALPLILLPTWMVENYLRENPGASGFDSKTLLQRLWRRQAFDDNQPLNETANTTPLAIRLSVFLQSFTVVMAVAIGVLLAGRMFMAESLSLGQMLGSGLLFYIILSPFAGTTKLRRVWWEEIKLRQVSAHLFQYKKPQANIQPAENVQGFLTLDNASFAFHAEAQILQRINLSFKPGVAGIYGQAGSGKTCLAKVLAGFYEPSTGQLRLDGYSFLELAPQWRRQIQLLTAGEEENFNGAIFDYLSPASIHSHAEVMAALRLANLESWVKRLPQEIYTKLGPGGLHLNSRLWQLLRLARALCQKPSVLILDEGLPALPQDEEEALLQKLSGKVPTLIILTSRLSLLALCEDAYWLHQGRIEQQGAPGDIAAAVRGHFN